MTTPAIRTIRENFPEASISVLVNPWVADVFSASPHVDEIIPYHKKTNHSGLKGMWNLAMELSGMGFDMAILLQNAFEAAVITKLAGIPVRAGYKRDCRGPLLTHGIPIPKQRKKIHQVHYYQDLLADLGLKKGSDELFLAISPENKSWARRQVEQLDPKGPVVGINPGAAFGPAKRWPFEKYGELAAQLEGSLGAQVLVFGTNADKEAAQVIQKYCSTTADFTGNTTLCQAMALIDCCDAFVTNDSGLMHVGAALKTPLVAIFGSTNPVTTGPFSANSVVVRKEGLDCSPCLKTHCKTNFECMDLSVNEIAGIVSDMVVD